MMLEQWINHLVIHTLLTRWKFFYYCYLDTCTWVTAYHTCCRFPFTYENTLYYSCTGDDNDRQWCYFGDDYFDNGSCDGKMLFEVFIIFLNRFSLIKTFYDKEP